MPHRRTFLAGAGLLVSGMAQQIQAGPVQRDRRLGVAQIGTKHAHASGKLATIQKYPNEFEIIGVVEADEGRRSQVANSGPYQGLDWLSMEQVLADRRVDLVLVEGDIDELLDIAEKCIRAGKHIHLDKPAGTDLAQFEEVLRIAKANSLLVQMGYMYRSNPAFQLMFEAVEQGWLGKVFEVDAVMSKKVGPDARAALARYPGGSMFELGCHLIDSLVAIMGQPKQVHAFNMQTEDDGLADNCLAVFEYPQATATIRSAVVEVDGFRRRHFVVCGTRGTLEIRPLDAPRVTLTLDQPQESRAGRKFIKGTQTVELPKAAGRYDGDLLALARAIRGDEPYPFGYAHDRLVQRLVLEASGMLDANRGNG